MKYILFLLLFVTGCSSELIRQRELLSISKLWAQKCKNDINNKILCSKAMTCIGTCQTSFECYQEYRQRQLEELTLEEKRKECSEKYLEVKKVCK